MVGGGCWIPRRCYDAVATQDTVTQLRAAIRKLLGAADRDAPGLAAAVRAGLARDDDYATLGKPPCDWDDPAAREALVDALVRDAHAALAALHGHELAGPVAEAAELLALVAGQDVEAGEDGVFRIARRVARDRVISTVDAEARHGHKSRARRFDGYKAHLGVDPDDELITNVAVTPANTADRDVIEDLLDEPAGDREAGDTDQPGTDEPRREGPGLDEPDGPGLASGQSGSGLEVYGDSAYADAQTLLEQAAGGNDLRAKVPPVRNSRGYSKDQFRIDPEAGTVGCPAGHTVPIRPQRRRRAGAFWRPMPRLPVTDGVHHRPPRAGDQHPSGRGHPAAGQGPPARPGLAAGLPHPPPDRGTQDRPLHPTTLGRAQSPLPRPGPDPHRRPHPSRRDQPRPTGHPRAPARTRRLGHRLTPAAPKSQRHTGKHRSGTDPPPHSHTRDRRATHPAPPERH